jgi:hypothetical protein
VRVVTSDDWSNELRLLRDRGVTLASGLTAAELDRVEQVHRFRFPPDLRSFLSCAMPQGKGFLDWRAPESDELLERLAWPFDGIAFDIEHNKFWWREWGSRPPVLSDAIAKAKDAVALAPRLVPIYSHRYLPSEPAVAGNPVFSVYQTDIIYYGTDLRRYFACEFGGLDHAEATRGDLRHIRFWSDLVEGNG